MHGQLQTTASPMHAAQLSWLPTTKRAHMPMKGFAGVQTVFGCYSAVALADAHAVQTLAAKLPFLFRHRSWQTGAYQVFPPWLQSIWTQSSFRCCTSGMHCARQNMLEWYNMPVARARLCCLVLHHWAAWASTAQLGRHKT